MSKPDLLLLHGALGNKDQFIEMLPLLKEHFQVWTMNFSGHSREAFEQHFSIELFVEDINRFFKENDIQSLTIFGYSMGGYVALKFASIFPDKVSRIITLGTKLLWNEAISNIEISKLDPELIEQKVQKLAQVLEHRYSAAFWKQVVRNTGLFISSLGQGKGLNFEDLSRIVCPVLLCRGSEDTMVTNEECLAVVEKLAYGKYQIIDKGHHLYERYEAVQLAKIILNKESFSK